MDTIGHISEFGDRGGLNGLRVTEDKLLQHSKAPIADLNQEEDDNQPLLYKRSVRFQGQKDESEVKEESDDAGHPGPPGSETNDDNTEKDLNETWLSKIQTWLKNNSKLASIVFVILVVIALIIFIYVLNKNKNNNRSGVPVMSNHNTARSLILGGE